MADQTPVETPPASATKPAKKPAKRRPTARQRKLMAMLLEVEQGKMTITDAMLQSGYSQNSAEQQTNTLRNLRENTVMQDALRKAGFTEELIAQKVREGLEAKRNVVTRIGNRVKVEKEADLEVQHKYLKTGAELLDAFPATKNIQATVGIADLIREQQATTPPDGDTPA